MTERVPTADAWYRQPVLWLGALVFGVFIAASIVTIELASRHADEPLPVVGERLLKMPSEAARAVDPPAGAEPRR